MGKVRPRPNSGQSPGRPRTAHTLLLLGRLFVVVRLAHAVAAHMRNDGERRLVRFGGELQHPTSFGSARGNECDEPPVS